MNTIEPAIIYNDRYITRMLRDDSSLLVEEDNDTLVRMERKRSKWITNILAESISNKEEDRRRLLEEINIFGYINIGPIKIGRRLFNILYWLKLIKI